MPYRLVISLLFIIAALLRLAGAMVSARPSHHATMTTASQPLDPNAAMADAQRRIRQMPDNIRTSHGGEVTFSDGSTRQLGDSDMDQAIRRAIAARSQAELDRDFPEPEETPIPVPGQPMVTPTPSR
jgi:hypothetical protein